MRKVDKVFQTAERGDIETLRKFLKPDRKGAVKYPGPDVATEDGWSMLMAASSNGHRDVVSFLLEIGAKVDARSREGFTALMGAAHSGSLEIAEMLIDAGADVHAMMTGESHGWNALFAAVNNGHTGMTEWLLEKGADANSRNIDLWSPLLLTARDGSFDIVKLLLDHGSDINCIQTDGWSPLSLAVYNDRMDIARLLIERGADVNSVDRKEVSILETAVERKNADIAVMLIENGADVSHMKKDGSTTLHKAVDSGMVKVVSLILQSGKADVNSADKKGATPLMRASRSNNVNMVDLLLYREADVNLKDSGGRTALDIARAKKKTKTISRLEQAGALPGTGAPSSEGAARGSVELPPILSAAASLQLTEAAAISPSGRGGPLFQDAIQCLNSRDSAGAARNFQKALDAGLDDLRAGYAYAELGSLRLMSSNVASAVECYLKVFSYKKVLYESAHEAAQYMAIIYSELGREKEAAGLESLNLQTQAHLGYSLDPNAAGTARQIVGRNKNQLS